MEILFTVMGIVAILFGFGYYVMKSQDKVGYNIVSDYSFVLAKSKSKEWFFKFVAPNGQTMFVSEMYKNKKDANSAILSIQANAHASDIKVN